MPVYSSFLGPEALWLEDESEGIVFQYALEEARRRLMLSLQARLTYLERTESIDDFLLEIRRQIASSAVDGHITEAADLHEIALTLVDAYRERKRL